MQLSKTGQPAPLLRDAKSRRALGEGVPAPLLRDAKSRRALGERVPATRRLPYKKPVVRSISLVADQVLGVGCKQVPPMGGLPLGANPALGCVVNSCKAIAGS